MSRTKPAMRETSVRPPTVRMRSIMAALPATALKSWGGGGWRSGAQVAAPSLAGPLPASTESASALDSCLVAFSIGKPVPTFPENALADAARLGCADRALRQAAHGDLQARHALLAARDRRAAIADRREERDQLGAQRFGVADRQVPHRIAAVRLEPEAFGHG